MMCKECGKRPATVHIKRVFNDKVEELHLCAQCAKERGELFVPDPTVVLQNFLAGLAGTAQGQGALTQQPTTLVCSKCGFSYQTFLQTGRLGCPECYRHFAEPLQSLLRRIQGHTAHVGKLPARSGGDVIRERQLEQLRQQLQQFVTEERYEDAATVRDQIRALEAKPEGGGSNVRS